MQRKDIDIDISLQPFSQLCIFIVIGNHYKDELEIIKRIQSIVVYTCDYILPGGSWITEGCGH